MNGSRHFHFAMAMLLAAAFTAGCSVVFTNPRAVGIEDVIYLSRHGLSAAVITGHIETTGSRFDLTTEDLVTLKDAGVDDEVIEYMVGRAGPQPPFADEYGRAPIPAAYGVPVLPEYYRPYRMVPLFESYSDYYGTTQYQYWLPGARRSGLVGRFYDDEPIAWPEYRDDRRDAASPPSVDRVGPDDDGNGDDNDD